MGVCAFCTCHPQCGCQPHQHALHRHQRKRCHERGGTRGSAASKSPQTSDEPENSTDQAGLSDAASAVIAALNQYVANQKSSSDSRIDQQRAQSIELLKQPAAEQIVAYIEQQASTIEQLRREKAQLRGYFEWNITSEDYSGLANGESVDSPHFSLGLGSEFWLRYYPKGVANLQIGGRASLFLVSNVKAVVWATLAVDSAIETMSPSSRTFMYSTGYLNMCASGKHHLLFAHITKVEFESPLNFTGR
ncbi:unnamed protein product [Symbiodinium sp. CCMP2456]|nr:unnamed protein product [Symbiodinium sp. CCMP2456]